MKIVRVKWIDAALHAEWTTSHEDANLIPVETVGFVLAEDRRVIKIAQSVCGGNRFSAIQSVPKSAIVSVKTLWKETG
jgi:hypothetical protein